MACVELFFNYFTTWRGEFWLDELAAIPEDDEERNELSFFVDPGTSTTSGVTGAAVLAARLARRRRWLHAAARFYASKRACSVHNMDLHPNDGRWFGVENDPVNHVLFAQAISTAYSALEDLRMEIKASHKKPSKLNGDWNSVVREEWEKRATEHGIDIHKKQLWLVRGRKNLLEQKRPLPAGERASWAKGPIRDREVILLEAIARADWLRDRAAAHALSKLSRSLTMLDVENVQSLVRRLILEQTGVLKSILRG